MARGYIGRSEVAMRNERAVVGNRGEIIIAKEIAKITGIAIIAKIFLLRAAASLAITRFWQFWQS
jgi:hypothetical protein